jgi:meiotic recombination protein SPO11
LQAKGYPDIRTRQFLHLLSTSHPHIPIFCLVDFDPNGMGIMSTYKYGSMALSHQNQNLAVPSIRWLGIRGSDILQMKDCEVTGRLKLTDRDRRIATRMLDKEIFQDGAREEGWRRELQIMLMLNCKAEIQILSSRDDGLEGWLDEKLLEALNEGRQ